MVQCLLFDLDETLYPTTSGLMTAISERMRRYLQDRFHLNPEKAQALQKRFWDTYGTTLTGLVLEHKIDPTEYLKYVHDVDVSKFLTPDVRLREVLTGLPFEKVVVTNGDVPHARRVLERLGIADQFTRIFDIVFMEYECKPARGAYERVLESLDLPGQACILIEDQARNLTAAHALGMGTVLLLPDDPPAAPNGKLPALAKQPPIYECPPDADLCISTIYEVGSAIQRLTAPAVLPTKKTA